MPVKFGFDTPILNTWLLLHQSFDMVLKVEEKEFARIGLTPQYNGVLMALKYKKGKVTIKELANWLDKNSNSISTLIDRMQRDGFVERMESKHDRREVHVVLTDKGKEMSVKAEVLGWKIINDVLGGVPEEDLRLLNVQLENVRGRAFAHLCPEESINEVKTTKKAGEMILSGKKRHASNL
ncbi:MAG: MarR family winged helix-turn-helix transcriptional regulator [Dehalococcoidales bacterium]|nr:MarR family winged helix-turn-helix transcriptional regulator [Dehalococcoidales bacterium]